MDTVTEAHLAIALAQEGGVGIIHKNMSIDAQAQEVDKVKRSESGMIVDPVTVSPDAPVAEALALMSRFRISGVPVTVGPRLVGILTNRDLRFESRTSLPVSQLMTKENLITVPVGTTLEEAREILHQHKVEKLLVVDQDFNLKGLITVKDIQKQIRYPAACKDALGRLRVGAALGVTEDILDRAAALVEAKVDFVAVDTAHGHSTGVLRAIESLRKAFPSLEIIGGNVGTYEGARDLVSAGVAAVKVGMGPGSICTTRVVSGAGMPQVTAVAEAARATAGTGIPVIADGGIKFSGDLVKAIAAGASSVMIGSLFAGTDESPGELILRQGRSFKSYRGMGSIGAMKAGLEGPLLPGATSSPPTSWFRRASRGWCPTRGRCRPWSSSSSAAFAREWDTAAPAPSRSSRRRPASSGSPPPVSRRATSMMSSSRRKHPTTASSRRASRSALPRGRSARGWTAEHGLPARLRRPPPHLLQRPVPALGEVPVRLEDRVRRTGGGLVSVLPEPTAAARTTARPLGDAPLGEAQGDASTTTPRVYLAGNPVTSTREETRAGAKGRSWRFTSKNGAHAAFPAPHRDRAARVHGLYAQGADGALRSGRERHRRDGGEPQHRNARSSTRSFGTRPRATPFESHPPGNETRRLSGQGMSVVQYTSPALGAERNRQTVHASLTITVEPLKPGVDLEQFYASAHGQARRHLPRGFPRALADGVTPISSGRRPPWPAPSSVASTRVDGGKAYTLSFEGRDDVFPRVSPWCDLIASTLMVGSEVEAK